MHHAKTHKRRWGLWIVLLVFVALGYVGFAGSTRNWPQTEGVIAGSRVVREEVPIGSYGSSAPIYRGEYQLRYQVRGSNYYVWVSAGWADKDRDFVDGKLSYAGSCRYRVRYNPLKPSQALAACAD